MLKLDHFIIGVPRLDEAIESFAIKTGVQPWRAGQHLALRTHNALVSLGAGAYLEFLAADSSLGSPREVAVEALRGITSPKLIGWVLRCDDFAAAADLCEKTGLSLSNVERGSRKSSAGVDVEYEFARPLLESVPDFAAPWLIRWISQSHPTQEAPEGCSLESFLIQGPLQPSYRQLQQSISSLIDLQQSRDWSVNLKVRTPKGGLSWSEKGLG